MDIRIVRLVVVLRVVVLAFVPHPWHITVRVAGYFPLQGKAPFFDEKTSTKTCHGHFFFWTREVSMELSRRENKALKILFPQKRSKTIAQISRVCRALQWYRIPGVSWLPHSADLLLQETPSRCRRLCARQRFSTGGSRRCAPWASGRHASMQYGPVQSGPPVVEQGGSGFS